MPHAAKIIRMVKIIIFEKMKNNEKFEIEF